MSSLESNEVLEFRNRIESTYKSIFPNGWIESEYCPRLMETVTFFLGVQPKEKHYNGISHNDPARQAIQIRKLNNGSFVEKMECINTNPYILVKPDNPYHVYSSVKLGWRKKTANIKGLEKHIVNYFEKMKKIIDHNKENNNLAHNID